MTGDEEVTEMTELVPVTEERWAELRELKAEGQSYDELIGLLVQEHMRRQLTDPIGEDAEDEREPRVRVDE